MNADGMVAVCKKCLRCVNSHAICHCGGGDRWHVFPIAMLGPVRILASKGWQVENVSEVVRSDGPDYAVTFRWLSPPVIQWLEKPGKLVWPYPELPRYDRPKVTTGHMPVEMAIRRMTDWARKVPKLTVPFAQSLCDKCKPQGADWFFCSCLCPLVGRALWFSEGLPEKCPYAAEHVLTMPKRVVQMRQMFAGNDIAQKLLSRSV